MAPEFVHHHVHSYFSLLDGLSSPDKIMETVKRHGMRGISITDHGTMSGAYEATIAAKKYDLKVNIGCELYFAENRHLHQTDRNDQRYYHLIAIATNMTGYRNLMKMQTIGHYEGYYFKPRVDFETLEQYGEGIVFTTACLGGHVNQALLQNDYEEAKHRLGMLTDAVGRDNVYVEIQNQGLAEEKRILPVQAQLAKEMNLPLLPTGDCHYAEPTQYDFHDSLLCASTNAKKHEIERFKFDSDEFYLMTSREMDKKFGDQDLYPNALKNTVDLLERCDFQLATGKEAGHIMPEIKVPEGETEDTILRERVMEGARDTKRYGDGHGNIPKEVEDRIDYELDIVKKMGFAGYFLIVSDLIEMFHEHNIEVGPGRGSAPGSVAVYSLGITNIDPMSTGLYFERFLNPDRISFPDIDIDIPKKLRSKALSLLQERYGQENVAHIANINRMDTRTAISRAAKVYGLSFSEESMLKDIVVGDTNKGDAHVPGLMEKHDMKLIEVVNGLKESNLPEDYVHQIKRVSNAEIILETAMNFVGVVFAEGIHACGIVIMPNEVDNYFPIRKSKKASLPVTQFDKDGIEDTGGVKMDLLGLETLDECEQAERNILLDLGEEVNTSNLTPDDPEVFEMLSRGEGSGVFQLACVAGDTMVDGISIKERNKDQYKNRFLRSVNLGEQRIQKTVCHVVAKAGMKKSVTMRTRGGRELTMSLDHMVFTSRGWTKASHVIPHLDRVIVVPGDPTIETPYNVNRGYSKYEVANMYHKMNPSWRRWDKGEMSYYTPDFVSADDKTAVYIYKSYDITKLMKANKEIKEKHPGMELKMFYTADIVEASYQTMWSDNKIPEEAIWDTVVSLELGDEVEMYDVLMSNPVRNFIANNIMVHNSGGMKNLLKEMKPESIFDLSALVALYRPGPLGMGTHIEYCKRKNGEIPVSEGLPHPDMEDLLKDTYGLVCYQEDVMNLAVHFGGYTGAEADHLRKATAKKIPKLMAEEKEKFVPSVNERNGNHLGDKLWEIIEPFSEYAFNRSHSAAYAVIAYRTAWLKQHYPAQYGAALLDNAGEKNKDKRKDYLSWMKRWGIMINTPDVNSTEKRTVTTKDSVTLSPMFMNGIGDSLISTIINERVTNGEYSSIVNFLSRVKVSENHLITMIKAGYFDKLHDSRRAMLYYLNDIMRMAVEQRSYDTVQDGLFGGVMEEPLDMASTLELDNDPDVTFIYLENETLDMDSSTYAVLEEQSLNIVCGKHPYIEYEDVLVKKAKDSRYKGAVPISDISDNPGKSWFYGIITAAEMKEGKNGPYYIITLSDDISDVKTLLFKDIKGNPDSLKGRAVMVHGNAKVEEGRDPTLFIYEMKGVKK